MRIGYEVNGFSCWVEDGYGGRMSYALEHIFCVEINECGTFET